MGEPGGLLSTGLYRVRHYRSDLAAAAAAAAEEFPGGPVLGLRASTAGEPGVQSLVRELRSQKLLGGAKKKKKSR